MSSMVTVTTREAAVDLTSFLTRARRVLDGAARVISDGTHLQVYVGILMPRGLLDRTPTVLGLRVAPLASGDICDVVVPLESLVYRIDKAVSDAQGEVVIELPAPSPSLHWPSISPPREGWKRRMGIPADQLADTARRGIEAIAEAIPDSVGEAVVQKVRAEVWGQPIAHKKAIPWGAGFAADALGFLDQRTLAVHTCGHWVRLSSDHGYVLVKGHEEPEGLGEPDGED